MSEELVHLAADGATATVSVQGAQVLAWQPAGATRSWLYLSPTARREAGHPIRGGIPILFPQFGLFGPLPKHGLVRAAPWAPLPRTTQSEASFTRCDDEHTRAAWPFAFELIATVKLAPRSLRVALAVTNRDNRAFTFTAGLHTYLWLADSTAARITGLADCRYLDACRDLAACPAHGKEPPAKGPVDRVYLDASAPLTVADVDRRVVLTQTGFEDVVVWNPGPESSLPDMPRADHRSMVCVEAAQIGRPVTLAPGASWTGAQTLAATPSPGTG